MIYAVARLAGWLPETCAANTWAFGNVLGTDRKMFKTRSGDGRSNWSDSSTKPLTVPTGRSRSERATLTRTSALISRLKLPERPSSTPTCRPNASAITSSTWSGCSPSRGDTGPYLQYAQRPGFARSFADSGSPFDPDTASFALEDPAERYLALGLLAFPEAFALSLEALQPHRLCVYLFDLAQRFHLFL